MNIIIYIIYKRARETKFKKKTRDHETTRPFYWLWCKTVVRYTIVNERAVDRDMSGLLA